jgi:hypothetical protein
MGPTAFALLPLLASLHAPGPVQPAASRPAAVPVEPIAAILDAFRSHELVALPDAHGNRQAHAFLLSLIRDPRFPPTVNDLVVTIGNARYQDLMDRFVRGDDVPYESLRSSWRDTTAPNTSADLPTHEELFRAVRAVNASLPRERQLRVLLADPPIDWDAVRSPDDYRGWYEMRVPYAAALIQIEVLAKQRRALVILGFPDLQRKNIFSNYDMQDWRAQTIVSVIEGAGPTRFFTIWGSPREGLATLQADVASWRIPSLALIRGTNLGAADFTAVFWSPPRAEFRDGKVVPVTKEQWRSLPAEDQLDALLYLGPPGAMTDVPLSKAVCTEPGYLETRLKRLAVSGMPPPIADELKAHCAGTKD